MDLNKLKETIKNMTQDELDEYFPKDTTPKGWVFIEDELPKMKAVDVHKGYTEYKVRYESGEEGKSKVSDHNTWYHYAMDVGITHWYNQ